MIAYCKGVIQIRTHDEIKQDVINHMQELGTYRAEFSDTINIFVDMLHQYEHLTNQFKDEGYEVTEEHTNSVGAVNTKKKPILTAIEKLRMDIATYTNILQLNPRHLGETESNSKSGTLNKILKEIS